jgi:hypothetical protein
MWRNVGDRLISWPTAAKHGGAADEVENGNAILALTCQRSSLGRHLTKCPGKPSGWHRLPRKTRSNCWR